MDEDVTMLKEDLKNARKMINCLNETIERLTVTNKDEKHEDLHVKMDKILKKLKRQSEIKKKVDYLIGNYRKLVSSEDFNAKMETLTEKVDKLTTGCVVKSQDTNKFAEQQENHNDIANSKEILKILDTVETTEGYSELFVKDFERIHGKLEEMDGAFSSELKELKQLQEQHRIFGLGKEVEQFGINMETKLDLILNEPADSKKEIQMDLKAKGVVIEELKKQTDLSLKDIEYYFGIKEPMLKCCYCNRILRKDLPRREDGVSVDCPYCSVYIIVETLKDGHKWMYVECCEFLHFLQFPIDQKEGIKVKCPFCEGQRKKEATLYDANDRMALRHDFKSVLREMESKIRGIETSVGIFSDTSLKCWSCESVLPKNLRKDGVSVTCSDCNNENIVGKIMPNRKWMKLHSSWFSESHYQQVFDETEAGEMVECIVCGIEDSTKDANDKVALPD